MEVKNYVLKRMIGSGQCGQVFLSENKETGLIVAIKRTLLNFTEQINKELDFLKLKIDCPYVVKYYESFEENDYKYFVMEYCKNGNLKQLIDKKKGERLKFTEKEMRKAIIQLIHGLSYFYEKKRSHGDIKPENILIDENGIFKLGDFGNMRDFTGTLDEVLISGTMSYYSPETMLTGKGSFASDIWTVGVCICEMMMLKHPFDDSRIGNLISAVVTKEIREIDLPQEYSPEIKELVCKMLHKGPQERISIRQLLESSVLKKEGTRVNLNITNIMKDVDTGVYESVIFSTYSTTLSMYRSSIYFPPNSYPSSSSSIPSFPIIPIDISSENDFTDRLKSDELILNNLHYKSKEIIGHRVRGDVVYKVSTKEQGEDGGGESSSSSLRCVRIVPYEFFRKEEIEKLKKLKNEHVVMYDEIYQTNKKERIVLVMEYVGDVTLKDFIDSHSEDFTPLEIYELIYQILSGVNALHEVQFVHKDLNLKNILCKNVKNKIPTLKIMDVGVQKTDFRNVDFLETSSISIFDPPEESFTSGEKADVWACGMIFYYISYRKEISKFSKVSEYINFISSFSYVKNSHTSIPWLEEVISRCLLLSFKERATVKELLELLPVKKTNINPSPFQNQFLSPASPIVSFSRQVANNICPNCQNRGLQVLENNTKRCNNCSRLYILDLTTNLFVQAPLPYY